MSEECVGCNAKIDCGGIDDLRLYSLEDNLFPFTLNCPFADCNAATQITLVCCGKTIIAQIPVNGTPAQRLAAISKAIAQCQLADLSCGSGTDGVITYYYSGPQNCTVLCPDGSPFTYKIGPGYALALTQDEANKIALNYACAQALKHRICLSDLIGRICTGVTQNLSIKATGQYLGVYPQQNFWEITSGSIPTGMTFNGGYQTGNSVTLTGAATAGGTFTFTVRVVAPNGDNQSKSYTIKVVGITNADPLDDGTVGDDYSVQLTTSGIDNLVFSVNSGDLPDGTSLDTELGVISGTPTDAGDFTFTLCAEGTLTGTATSVTCFREYTITIEALPPPPDSYWKFDALTGTITKVTPDAISTRDMSKASASAPALVAGGIFSNCLSFNNKSINPAPAAYFRFNSGFTARFWVKYDGTFIPNGAGAELGQIRLTSDPQRIQFWLSCENWADDDHTIEVNGPFAARIFPPDSGGILNLPQNMTENTWNHIVIRWVQPTSALSLCVNGVVTTATVSLTSVAVANGVFNFAPNFSGGHFSTPVLIDEVATWDHAILGRAVTDAEILSDYNGGIGRTWPW